VASDSRSRSCCRRRSCQQRQKVIRNWRGHNDVMQTRSFRGSGEPARVNASSNACERLGPGPRRALGPAAIRAASTGRTHDRTRPMLHQRKKLLSIRRRPHMTQCMVRPCVARELSSSWRMCGLASMYPAFDWSMWCSGPSWISARVRPHYRKGLMGHLGHQCSHAPGRPILHLVSHPLADLGR
jgi:hypothetical protein